MTLSPIDDLDLAPRLPDSWRTFREERREALESVLEELKGPQGPDARAACAALLRHFTAFPTPVRVS